jgi:hypothetical protein
MKNHSELVEYPEAICSCLFILFNRTARMCALYRAYEYNGEREWKDIGDRLQAQYYWSRVDRFRKIRRDVGK